MEVCNDVRRRNYLVCARQNCHKCNDVLVGRGVPKDCEFEILHVLEIESDCKWQGRQTGKTDFLIDLALKLCGRFPVYYVVDKLDMVRHMKRYLRMKDVPHGAVEENIVFLSKHQIARGTGLRGRRSGLVILDEVRPGEVEEHLVPPLYYPIVAARWT